MARRYYSSTAIRTTLSTGITGASTQVTVAANTGFPTSYPWTAIIDQDTVNEEVVSVTSLASGTTYNITRAQDGTSAVSHSSGAAFNHGVSARDFDEPNSHVNTDVSHVTVCTSATRPGSPSAGQVIFESDTKLYYGWNGTAWSSIGGGATGGGTDQVFLENGQTVTTNYTLTTNKNAVSAGTITINSGVTVTIPTGASWVIV